MEKKMENPVLEVGQIVRMREDRVFARDDGDSVFVRRGARFAITGHVGEWYYSRLDGKTIRIRAGTVALVTPCEKCNLLFELYDRTPQTPRDYWLMTELFVRLHGTDICQKSNE